MREKSGAANHPRATLSPEGSERHPVGSLTGLARGGSRQDSELG